MKSRILFASFLLVLSAVTAAQQPPDHIDPALVSPDKYTVLLENEHVRVLEYQILPGEKEAWHTHPPKVAYILSGGKLRITTEDGDSFVVEEDSDNVAWMNAVGRHFGENIGTTPIRIVLVEIKSLADAPFEEIAKRD
jgi:quercetin dioxygenase-like cupin family protein